MSSVFLLLFLLSIMCLVVGLIRPTIFSKLHISSRKRSSLIFSLAIVTFFILFGIVTPANPTPPSVQGTKTQPALTPTSTIAFTPTPSLTQSNRQRVKVVKVIDGDTIEIEGGKRVRYIGINTPETKDPRKPVECFAQEAYLKNKELVEGKTVELEKDISETDKYDRLLRYVYLGSVFVNELLVKEGLAYASSYPPDVKFQELFRKAQSEAEKGNKGLWSSCKTTMSVTPTVKPSPTKSAAYSTPQTTQQTSPATGGSYTCNCAKSCSAITSCDEAYYQLNTCGCSERDGDSDGVPCESLCQ